jgi:ATP adenylyltransferase
MAYINMDDAPKPGPTGCIFCDKSADNNDVKDLIIYRGKLAFVLMNLYPYNSGHLMIAPYRHTAILSELSDDIMLEMMQLTARAQQALSRAFHPDGYNIGINLGRVAGAGIADHIHQHIVPRWNGDSNFMPVLAETKVMPDSLENSYRKIVDAWEDERHV